MVRGKNRLADTDDVPGAFSLFRLPLSDIRAILKRIPHKGECIVSFGGRMRVGLSALLLAAALSLSGCFSVMIPIDGFFGAQSETASSQAASRAVAPPEDPPAVEGLTPLARADYGGLVYLRSQPGADRLVDAYYRLAAGVEKCEESIQLYDGENSVTVDELPMVYACYRSDFPQHFWLGGYSYYHEGEWVSKLEPSYSMRHREALLQKQQAMEDAAVQLLVGVGDSLSEYERVLRIHDALCGWMTYGDEATGGTYIHTAYGALFNRIAVCDGYARAFQYLLHRAGIRTLMVYGESENPASGESEGHAWTIAYIDGQPYHFDITWDDQDYLSYAYFGLTTARVEEDHSITGNDYTVPVCTADEANYFVRSGGLLAGCDLSAVAALLQQGDGTARVYLAQGDMDAFLDWFISDETGLHLARKLGIYGYFTLSYSVSGREALLSLTAE